MRRKVKVSAEFMLRAHSLANLCKTMMVRCGRRPSFLAAWKSLRLGCGCRPTQFLRRVGRRF